MMEAEVIVTGEWDRFLTLDREELLLVKRKHPYVTVPPIIATGLLGVFFLLVSYLFFVTLLNTFSLFLISAFLLIATCLGIVAKILNDWFFHLYILTTRKILEVWYAPLSSHIVNDVMLDKVNCTEIDVKRQGLLNELFDIGDIVITFDRPTHQEEFVLQDIKGCYKLGVFLTKKLIDHLPTKNLPDTIWVKPYGIHGYKGG